LSYGQTGETTLENLLTLWHLKVKDNVEISKRFCYIRYVSSKGNK